MRRNAPTLRGPLLIVGLLTLLLAACGGQEDPAAGESGLTRAEFIDVVVALRNAELDLEVPDSVFEERFRARRDSILDAHDTSQDELYDFLDRHTDLQYMDAVWDTITERLKRPAERMR